MRLVREVMDSFCNSGSREPPVCIAYDNGSSNATLNAFLLGLVQPEEMATYPFFSSCRVRQITNIKMFPFGCLRYAPGCYVTGSNDAHHTLKNWTLQHTSGSRCVQHGASLVCLTSCVVFYHLLSSYNIPDRAHFSCVPTCLAKPRFTVDIQALRDNGLPVSAHCCRDPQSDKASNQRLCAAYLKPEWRCDGLYIYAFLGNLMSSAWNAGLSPRLAFKNAALGYYLLLLHVSEGKRLHGECWRQRCVPTQTARNCCHHLMAHCMMSAMFTAHGLPWRLASRQELFAETHFGKVKAAWRGTPCLRDALFSSHLENLKALKQKHGLEFPDLPAMPAVSSLEAAQLSEEALRHACFFQSGISKGRAAANIKHDLLHWYNVEGLSFLTMNRKSSAGADDPEAEEEHEWDASWTEVLEQDGPDTQEDEASQALEACDDHLKAHTKLYTIPHHA